MNVEIVRLGPRDMHRLDRYDEDIFDAEIVPERLAALLRDPGHLLVCAFADGVAIGQARGVLNRQPDAPTSLSIDNLGVAPSRRREGIAGRLLDELVAWGRENGCATAWVATELDNDAARALYAGRDAETSVIAYYTYAL